MLFTDVAKPKSTPSFKSSQPLRGCFLHCCCCMSRRQLLNPLNMSKSCAAPGGPEGDYAQLCPVGYEGEASSRPTGNSCWTTAAATLALLHGEEMWRSFTVVSCPSHTTACSQLYVTTCTCFSSAKPAFLWEQGKECGTKFVSKEFQTQRNFLILRSLEDILNFSNSRCESVMREYREFPSFSFSFSFFNSLLMSRDRISHSLATEVNLNLLEFDHVAPK